MSYTFDLLLVLADQAAKSEVDVSKVVWGFIGLVFAIIGASFIAAALWPQFKATYQHKNTIGLNVPMFSFHTLVAFLFLLGSIFMIPAVWGFKESDFCMTVGVGVIYTLLNVFGFAGNYYVITLKLKNMSKAKSLGMSEAEYYEKEILPTLKK